MSSQDKFSFNQSFQIQILALMKHDYDFLILVHELIVPKYFSNDILAWFFVSIRDYFLDYQSKIGDEALKNELLKAASRKQIKKDDIPEFIKIHDKLNEPIFDEEYIQGEVLNFCRHQAIKSTVMELPVHLKNNEFDTIEEKMQTALQTGLSFGDMGIEYFSTWPDRVHSREKRLNDEIMPTGITELDRWIGGGLKVKQLGIWMGPANRGKSISLIHCGKRAIVSRKNVLHYTLEMPQEDVAERYDASFSRIPVKSLYDQEAQLSNKLQDLGRRWGNSLIIKDFPPKTATVNTIKTHINQCKQIQFTPDLVLIDYLDLLKPLQRRKEKRDELSDITGDLSALSKKLNVPVWTATQSNRAAISLETHTEEHVSEDLGKVAIADIVITINQTSKEVDEGIMRLFLAKNRNGQKYKMITIQTDLPRMCFYEPA